ncbi:hypothetical protein L1987_09485 [Smallanthus sonchifolius]|uniref:Uncharacterized protein n=1 Tax=Smallanthus sonchifolius TaxID=185202 RepID=A0ACB9JNJ8_9ASTR|nr:hypothetical protein L1987_09485 [Smallanthus sonchifolius]
MQVETSETRSFEVPSEDAKFRDSKLFLKRVAFELSDMLDFSLKKLEFKSVEFLSELILRFSRLDDNLDISLRDKDSEVEPLSELAILAKLLSDSEFSSCDLFNMISALLAFAAPSLPLAISEQVSNNKAMDAPFPVDSSTISTF